MDQLILSKVESDEDIIRGIGHLILNIDYAFYVVATQRKYESLRKQWLDEQKENYKDIVEEREKKKKYRSRRQRVRS